MDELKQLIRKRGAVKSRLTIFTNFLQDISVKTELDQLDIIKLNERLTNAENYLHDFNEHQVEIELLEDESKMNEQLKEREQFENSYYEAIALSKSISHKYREKTDDVHSNHSSSHTGHSNNISVDGIKLPDISLPKFNGKFEDWLEFRDIYKSLIHNNKRLSDIQKFYYLRSALEGTAAASISKIKYTADSYEVAWTTITSRFDNTKKLIYEHIKAIFSIENIQKPTSEKIQILTDDINKHLGSIEQLEQNIENWDPLLIFWLTNKLDTASNLEWERETAKKEDIPTIDTFLTFLQRRANFIDTLESKNNLHINKQESKGNPTGNKYSKHNNIRCLSSANYMCAFCKKDHSIYVCQEFLKLNVPQKRDFVKKSNLCFNCLRAGHSKRRCRLGPCKECKAWHNTILHDKNEVVQAASSSSTAENIESNSSNALSSGVAIPVPQQVILSTVCILVDDKFNNFNKIRALLDCGSQTSFITEQLQEQLGIDTQKTDLTIFGITNTNSNVDKKCKVFIRSMHSEFETNCNCYVLKKITGVMPSCGFSTKYWAIPNNITLADPLFYKPSPIDMLIGADLFWTILGVKKVSLGKNMPLLYETSLGWVVSGQLNIKQAANISCHISVNQELLETISKFWEVEELQSCKQLSEIEQFCETNFIKTTVRDTSGRFIVTMPLKQNPTILGESRLQAEKRFYALERKFRRDALLYDRYKEFMVEYRDLGHMTLINDKLKNNTSEYFMPHHGVINENSLTTKLRVVFDASSPSSNGLSLNNIQAVGPVLQDDLLSIILRFRKHNYVISADIAKMYRQVLIASEQRHLQKIYWRENPNDNLDIYTLNTVTYGQTSASYLAIRCLFSLAESIQKSMPDIADIIKHDFYVDDLLTGAPTIDQARYICESVSKTLESGGFHLRKWSSNNLACLENVTSYGCKYDILEFTNDSKMKTLGLTWSCKNDELVYNINVNSMKTKVTKRSVLSIIAKIFDPLGLVSPCTILAKQFMQRLWADERSWDDSITGAMLDVWMKFENELPILKNLKLNRQAVCKDAVSVQLHGFADSSEKSFGACIYLRSVDSRDNIHTALLCAKSKVAPIKAITIPRLELCAALLLARLFDKVKGSMKLEFESSTLWSDSTITLAWIRTSSNLLKTFTANRVADIQSLTKDVEWRYIPSHDNPADIVSRGIYPSEILDCQQWWHGPSWLLKNSSSWPITINKTIDLPDLKSQVVLNVISFQLNFPFERFSNFSKRQRATAYILRFKHNCLHRDNKNIGPLTVQELSIALNCLIKICQQHSFFSEIRDLQNNKALKSHSTLSTLCPFLDSDNILRVGGRLKYSDFQFNKKHPILIHSKHHFTKLLFSHEHKRLLHGGSQLLLGTIREVYWPLAGRNLARNTVKKCVTCFRFAARTIQPIMANLPRDRVCPSSAFTVVGVDYAGPFTIKDRKGKGCRSTKCYIGLFICLSTKAVHLELISSLSSEAFIQALYRFVSRRGKPSKILSDNGTNFVGAQRELKEFLKKNNDEIIGTASSQAIEWCFIPPYSPHFGGLWEAAVKSVKHHLKRIISNTPLLFEEFSTILSQIKAILNSRPLCPLSSDPNDFGPLTPAHLIIGKTLVAAPDQDVTDINVNRLLRFQLLQQISQQFWKRWKADYIAELQRRTKWKSSQGALNEGSLVLIKDERTLPTQWMLGRICELHKGPDARVASIKTQSGIIKRGFQKICPLPSFA